MNFMIYTPAVVTPNKTNKPKFLPRGFSAIKLNSLLFYISADFFSYWCSPYYRTAILKSLEQLILLGALTDDYKLSDPVGHQMARLPLDPMYSKSLIVSSKFKCLEEMLIVVSMLSVESIFFSVREKLEEVSIWITGSL